MAVRRSLTIRIVLLIVMAGVLGGCVGGATKSSIPKDDLGHPLPAVGGANFDVVPTGKRLEVRPLETTMPVGKQLLLIATVYDDKNKPWSNRRVEWMIDGPGSIVDVDTAGTWFSRGKKVDSKYAFSFSDSQERRLPQNIENPMGQVARAGQTWCVIAAAIEGETVVTAYAPEITDASRNRVSIKAHWIDAHWQFPEPSGAKAGGEMVLSTQITRDNDRSPASSFRVRYTLVKEGPTAMLSVPGVKTTWDKAQDVLVVAVDANGLARVTVSEMKAEFGTSKVGIEVLRPDASQPGTFTIIGRTETTVDWQAPQIKVSIDAPKTAALNQAFPITYSVSSVGSLETLPMVLKAIVPPGCQVVSTVPKATADGNELLWSLPGLPGGKQQSVQAIFKPTQMGDINLASSVRTNDNLRSDATAALQATEPRVQVSLTGAQTALVGENMPFQIVVKNAGTGPATNLKVKAQFDAGLEVVSKPGPFEVSFDKLDAGETQTIALPLTPKQAGKSAVKAVVTADGNQSAESPAVGIDVKKPDIKVEVQSPANGYLNQDITIALRVFNPGEVHLSNVVVRAVLPPEMTFKSASNDGKLVNGAVEWNLGTAVGKQWMDLQVTVTAAKLGKAVLAASVIAAPLANSNGEFKTVSMAKFFGSEKAEATVEILGIPALHIDVSDSPDPAQVGQTVTYTIRVKNTGTLPANQVAISAALPPQTKPIRAFGPSNGKIDGQNVTFAVVDSIKPGIVSAFTIEAQAISEGDGRFRAEVKSLSMINTLASEEATKILPKK